MPFDGFTGSVVVNKRNKIIHKYKGVDGLHRYISKRKLTYRWQVQPYMVDMYRKTDGSGVGIITFMDLHKAKFGDGDFDRMAAMVKRWRNLNNCALSEFHQIDEDTYRLELIHRNSVNYTNTH